MNDFETKLKRLEEIGERLRSGEIPIAEATQLFEEGMTLSHRLEKELQEMERRLEILLTDPENTEEPPRFAPFSENE